MPHQYLSNQEFIDAPTGLNLSTLIPSGSSAQETQAITRLLQRASGVVNMECQQTLYAETRTDTFRVWPTKDGNLAVLAPKFPVTSVESFSFQPSPFAGLTVVDPASVVIDPGVYPQTVRAYGLYGFFRGFGELTVQMQYTAGFVCTFFSASSTVSSSTISIVDSTGIYAGTILDIEDGINSESVTVQSVTGTTVTLTSPTLYAHSAGAGVSTVPQAIKQATIMFATFILNERSTGEIEFGFGQKTASVGKVKNTSEYDAASALLRPWKRMI